MALRSIRLLRLKLVFLSSLVFFYFIGNGQGYVSIYKTENGKVVQKSGSEIRAEEAKLAANKSNASFPKEFDKPKSGVKSNGEIWIDGYCRYRPPSYGRSRYNEDLSENEYCREKYPYDTLVQSDDFSGNGTIPWAENLFNQSEEANFRQFQQRLTASLNDGLPFPMYDSLKGQSWYHLASARGYKKGREYEFSRSVSFWIKRKSGPEKLYVKMTTEYPFSNGEDRTDFEVNDKGQFKVSRFCDNCKSPQYKEIESGKSKAWKEGDWNEITVKKDQYNTVTVYINEEEVCRYQLTALPITARFARFSLSMPYKWEKEKLMYHIGRITSISYPKAY